MPINLIAPGQLIKIAARFLTVLVILLCATNGYGTEPSGGTGDTAGNSAKSAFDALDFKRLLDREYLLESGVDLPGQWGVATFYNQSESKLRIEKLR